MTTATVDDRKRLRLLAAEPGQVFAIESHADGSFRLVPLVPRPEPKRVTARLVNRADGLFIEIPKGYKLDPESIAQAVREERQSRS
jgi:hypothetical protein